MPSWCSDLMFHMIWTHMFAQVKRITNDTTCVVSRVTSEMEWPEFHSTELPNAPQVALPFRSDLSVARTGCSSSYNGYNDNDNRGDCHAAYTREWLDNHPSPECPECTKFQDKAQVKFTDGFHVVYLVLFWGAPRAALCL